MDELDEIPGLKPINEIISELFAPPIIAVRSEVTERIPAGTMVYSAGVCGSDDELVITQFDEERGSCVAVPTKRP